MDLFNYSALANTQFVKKPTRLEILKKAKKYNYSDNSCIPNFSYQLVGDLSLIEIRKKLKLDSIAGKGSELSQIFNLMHWVHNNVKHDGGISNPKKKNALDLINICEAENRGINCRMMAILLNECYLSMGIKSRYIACMPKETNFDECHVINMVYSTELNKWIWIDPSLDAYVMDEKGNLLGIQEVRERLIEGKPLILNADANLNKTYLQKKERYLDEYMAKNLYRLQTPLVSEYNSETRDIKKKEITFVELLPLDEMEQIPQTQKEEIIDNTGFNRIIYKTNNPDVFWAKPY